MLQICIKSLEYAHYFISLPGNTPLSQVVHISTREEPPVLQFIEAEH